MKTKRQICAESVKSEDWKTALKLARGFDAVFNKEELSKIQIAYECLIGKSAFYITLKYDISSIIYDSKNILLAFVLKSDSKNNI